MPAVIRFVTRIYELRPLNLHYLRVPKAVISKGGEMMKQRLLCTANKTATWQCGLVALRGGEAYISINRKMMKKLGATLGDQINVSLTKDLSKYGLTMCDELKSLLAQDKEGYRRFHLLTPGKQRYIIYYVGLVKGSQLRVDRSIRLIENLKQTREGKERFRDILASRK